MNLDNFKTQAINALSLPDTEIYWKLKYQKVNIMVTKGSRVSSVIERRLLGKLFKRAVTLTTWKSGQMAFKYR